MLRSIAELQSVAKPIVVAIGVFDGVHLGHQALIRRAQEEAGRLGAVAVVLTFDPHPVRVLRPAKAPRLLTSTPHKQRLIEKLGVNWLVLQPFDAAFAAQPPEVFIQQLAASAQPLKSVCVGHQWAFGKGRAGNVELLRQAGKRLNFEVVEIPPVEIAGQMVSSTRIRKAVEAGDFATAESCLGRSYTILGTVEHGAQLGGKIGFPTANLSAHSEQFPPNGVYAVRALVDDHSLNGVANIGIRPTVTPDAARTLEVHLFDFREDLYGCDVEVQFETRLRDEQKFDSLDALKNQIRQDCESARRVLEV
ncbi:MAG TPA: bifunctional riboflavin kinase/FAD synthetase [Chthoniobacterales bacterium]